MRKAVSLLVVALLPALLAGLASLAGNPPPPQLQAATLAPVPAVAPSSTPPRASAVPQARPTPGSDAIRRQFESATNYAAFIHDAMQRPGEGGRFYAYLANARCTEFASWRRSASTDITGDPALYEKALRRIEDLQRRCSGVNSDFGSQLGFARAFLYASDKTPDALMITPGPRSGTDAGSIDADLTRARQAGDPYLLAMLIEASAGQLGARIDPAFADPAAQEVLHLAAAAAACQIVGDCTDSLQLHMQCFAGGQCEYGDRRQALRAQVPAQSQALFDRTVQALLTIAR
ncbi:MAG: hypothetical protein V4723_14300 [Pseudomonadota bacterium]